MKMHIVHVYIHCSLKVDGSITAGVLSSFCVVPESSYSSNPAISSLMVALSSNCYIQLVAPSHWWLHSKTCTLKETTAETGGCSAPSHFMWITITVYVICDLTNKVALKDVKV